MSILHKALLGAAIILLFLSTAGAGWRAPFVRGADIAGWTASTAANVRTDRFQVREGRWHQSPLLYLGMYPIYKVFGKSEQITRTVPLLATLAAGVLLFLILRRLDDDAAGLLGAFAFLIAPPVVVFAMSNNHIVFSLTAIFAALYVWLRWPQRFGLQLAVTLLAMWTYWHAYFLPFFFAWQERRWRWAVVPFASFAAFALFNYYAWPYDPFEILKTALERSGATGGAWRPLAAMHTIAAETFFLWSPIILFVALAGLKSEGKKAFIAMALFGLPILYWLAMARIAAIEPMLNALLLAPALAVTFAYGVKMLPSGFWIPILLLTALHTTTHVSEWQHRLYNIHLVRGYELVWEVIRQTRPGDTIFEDGHEIGPGRLRYYAWDRQVISATGMKEQINDRSYLVTTRDRANFDGFRLQEVQQFSPWTIYRVSPR